MSDEHIDEFGGKAECSVHHLPQPCEECWKLYRRSVRVFGVLFALILLLAPVATYKLGQQKGQRGADRWWQTHPLVVTCGMSFLGPEDPGQILRSDNGKLKWEYPLSETRLRKAFLDHEKHEYLEVKKDYPNMGGEAFVLSEKWKHYERDAHRCPAIAEIVKLSVNKTIDTGNFVIRMMGPDADEWERTDTCSLWIDGKTTQKTLDVRDFTPY